MQARISENFDLNIVTFRSGFLFLLFVFLRLTFNPGLVLAGFRTTRPQGAVSGADPGFLLGGGAPLRNDVTIQDFS